MFSGITVPTRSSIPDEAWGRAVKFLTEKENWAATTNYSVISKKGGGWDDPVVNAVCHRSISSNNTPARCLVASEIGWQRRGPQTPYKTATVTPAIIEPFLRWWLYESYMGPYILNRDDFDFVRDNGIIVSADIPASLLQCLMITSRHFYELSKECFVAFNDLVERGIHSTLAYVSTILTTYSNTPSAILNQKVVAHTNHRPHCMPSLTALENMLKGNVGTAYSAKLGRELTDPLFYYTKSTSYSGGVAFFFNSDDYAEKYNGYHHFVYQLFTRADFITALRIHRKELNKEEVVYRPPNPFEVKPLTQAIEWNEVTYTEFYDFVVPWVNENIIPQWTTAEKEPLVIKELVNA